MKDTIENQFVVDEEGILFQLFEEKGIGSLKTSRIFYAEQIKYARPICLKLAIDDRSFEREHKVLECLVQSIEEEKKYNGSSLPVIPVSYGYGKIKSFEGRDWNYLVRDFFSGISLTRQFSQKEPSSMSQRIYHIIETMRKISLYISYIHKRGEYHGDIKPDDFVINRKEVIYLVDYETVLKEGKICNDHHEIFGAPEKTGLIELTLPGKASDIYSLGMASFALLLANNPKAYGFFLSSQCLKYELLERTNSEFNLGIPKELMNVLLKATSYEPSNRFKSVEEYISALTKAKNQSRI